MKFTSRITQIVAMAALILAAVLFAPGALQAKAHQPTTESFTFNRDAHARKSATQDGAGSAARDVAVENVQETGTAATIGAPMYLKSTDDSSASFSTSQPFTTREASYNTKSAPDNPGMRLDLKMTNSASSAKDSPGTNAEMSARHGTTVSPPEVAYNRSEEQETFIAGGRQKNGTRSPA